MRGVYIAGSYDMIGTAGYGDDILLESGGKPSSSAADSHAQSACQI